MWDRAKGLAEVQAADISWFLSADAVTPQKATRLASRQGSAVPCPRPLQYLGQTTAEDRPPGAGDQCSALVWLCRGHLKLCSGQERIS